MGDNSSSSDVHPEADRVGNLSTRCPVVSIAMGSQHISFPKIRMRIEEMMSDTHHVSATTSSSTKDVAGSVLDLSTIVRHISLMQTTLTELTSPDEHLIGHGNVHPVNTFQSLSRH